jgi:thiamine-phosphate pyrophosphorylase
MDLRLIVITDARLAAPRTIEDVLRSALEAGAPAVQLRKKAASSADLFEDALALRRLTRDFGALLFINDRLDIAVAAEADGVHLGPGDLPVAAARVAARKAGRPDLLIGASTDHPDRARSHAADGAAYIGCGAVFGTRSKPEVADERIGTDRLRQVVDAVSIPVVGIGGITPGNVAAVADAGAHGAAVIGAVMAAEDPAAAVRALLAPFPRRGSTAPR